MKTLYGKTLGLKKNQIRRIENLYRRRVPKDFLVTPEIARDVSRISHEIRRQIGLLIDRHGKIIYIVIGDRQKIVIPDTPDYRTIPGRLKGLRCVHTHLNQESLTKDDLTDLALLRLDLMAAIEVSDEGLPHHIHVGHILPRSTTEEPYRILPPMRSNELDFGCLELISALESEMAETGAVYDAGSGKERAFLVSITAEPRKKALGEMAELKELALSNAVDVVGSILQQRNQIDPRYLMGRGKLQELSILAQNKHASLIIFDQELNPSQMKSITDQIDLKVIDRTQLILDIFSRRALTREGKLQVELAQLKYMFPRLVGKNTALSRLAGGIGGRGPGETKLEIDRRRIRDRIKRLEKALDDVRKHRNQQKAQRSRKGLPVISIIGYTNAGKSTLLNALTQSNVLSESRLFATLDPSSRRLKFPRDAEVIITDTVGFIKDLPTDLMVAFRATLEELESADILLHIIDISNPRYQQQIQSVENILADLELDAIPVIRVLNKMDLLDDETVEQLQKTLNGIPISAKNRATFAPLIEEMETRVERLDNASKMATPSDDEHHLENVHEQNADKGK